MKEIWLRHLWGQRNGRRFHFFCGSCPTSNLGGLSSYQMDLSNLRESLESSSNQNQNVPSRIYDEMLTAEFRGTCLLWSGTVANAFQGLRFN